MAGLRSVVPPGSLSGRGAGLTRGSARPKGVPPSPGSSTPSHRGVRLDLELERAAATDLCRVSGRLRRPHGCGRLVVSASRCRLEPCVRFSRTRLSDILHRSACAFPWRTVPLRVWTPRRWNHAQSYSTTHRRPGRWCLLAVRIARRSCR